MPTTAPTLDTPPAARSRWWKRPLFYLCLYEGIGVLSPIIRSFISNQPLPSGKELLSRAVIFGLVGLACGFGGNWLATTGKQNVVAGPAPQRDKDHR